MLVLQKKIVMRLNGKIMRYYLPSIVSTNAPHSNGMDRLRVEYGEIFRINKFESTFVQVQKQVFSLKKLREIKKTFTKTVTSNLHHPIGQRHQAGHFCQKISQECIYLQLLMSVLELNPPPLSLPILVIAQRIEWVYQLQVSMDNCVV